MPRYFNNFPKLAYTRDGVTNLATDLLTRIATIKGNIDDASLYYKYSIQEGDTPEMIASKYYNDPELHWIVLVFNDIIDPFYDWPMHYQQLIDYITNKYGSIANAQSTIDHYEKIIESIDNYSGEITKNVYVIDEETYNNLPTGSVTKSFANGITVTVNTDKASVTQFDNENIINESKRVINLVRKELIADIKNQFTQLMSV
jgi:hypothetical protein